jgi:hypothetical protein
MLDHGWVAGPVTGSGPDADAPQHHSFLSYPGERIPGFLVPRPREVMTSEGLPQLIAKYRFLNQSKERFAGSATWVRVRKPTHSFGGERKSWCDIWRGLAERSSTPGHREHRKTPGVRCPTQAPTGSACHRAFSERRTGR